jgi:hypothetical protein
VRFVLHRRCPNFRIAFNNFRSKSFGK